MEDDNTISEPSKWALERARAVYQDGRGWMAMPEFPGGDAKTAHDAMVRHYAVALDAARREALEEAAALCDASEARVMEKLRKLKKPNADLAGAAAVGAADNAEKLARRIRALKDREDNNG